MMTDPIADMLTRIRNAVRIEHPDLHARAMVRARAMNDGSADSLRKRVLSGLFAAMNCPCAPPPEPLLFLVQRSDCQHWPRLPTGADWAVQCGTQGR